MNRWALTLRVVAWYGGEDRASRARRLGDSAYAAQWDLASQLAQIEALVINDERVAAGIPSFVLDASPAHD